MVSKLRSTFCLLALVAIVPVADAQRNSIGFFEGTWKTTLTMDVLYGIPAEHIERLSKPVALEIRMFARGPVELYFTFEEDEWEFTSQRGYRITVVRENNGVIEARIPGLIGWMNSLSFNMTKQTDDTLLLSWSRLTTRNEPIYNGLDEMGFSGVAVLQRQD